MTDRHDMLSLARTLEIQRELLDAISRDRAERKREKKSAAAERPEGETNNGN